MLSRRHEAWRGRSSGGRWLRRTGERQKRGARMETRLGSPIDSGRRAGLERGAGDEGGGSIGDRPLCAVSGSGRRRRFGRARTGSSTPRDRSTARPTASRRGCLADAHRSRRSKDHDSATALRPRQGPREREEPHPSQCLRGRQRPAAQVSARQGLSERRAAGGAGKDARMRSPDPPSFAPHASSAKRHASNRPPPKSPPQTVPHRQVALVRRSHPPFSLAFDTFIAIRRGAGCQRTLPWASADQTGEARHRDRSAFDTCSDAGKGSAALVRHFCSSRSRAELTRRGTSPPDWPAGAAARGAGARHCRRGPADGSRRRPPAGG